VIKDDAEDRPIAPLERLNALVDPNKIPGVEYGFIPQLGTLTIDKHQGARPPRILVSKRDARHYYPSLLAGALWPPWFAGPPIYNDGKKLWPCHRTWPQGFRGSCGIAQAVTEVATTRAALPVDKRLLPSALPPLRLPCWGSILDDVWALYTDENDPVQIEASHWLERVDDEWVRMGVKTHPKKVIDRGVNAEIQGGRVHSTAYLVGLSAAKTIDIMCSAWYVLSQFKPSRRSIERVVGKIGHAHTFRSCMRGSFGSIYKFLQDLRTAEVSRTVLPIDVWWQLWKLPSSFRSRS
jgi:hypothetical protein